MIATRTLITQQMPGDAKARTRWNRSYTESSKFYHVRLKLTAAALPVELEYITANQSAETPLVVDVNVNAYGSTGVYTPKAVIVAGGAQRKRLLAKGEMFATGWVGERALEAMGIAASDGISADELRQKVQAAISKKYTANRTPDSGGLCDSGAVWVMDVYPFDNEAIFQMYGKTLRQKYTINTTTREVKLDGPAAEVEREYVEVKASSGTDMFACFPSSNAFPYIPTGVRVPGNFTLPAFFGISPAPKDSELNNPLFGEPFLNVDKVVDAYLANIRNGYHKPILPPSAPVPGVRMLFAQEVNRRGVESPADFFQWINANKDKSLGDGEKAKQSDFAHVGDPKDKSTWKLPIHDKVHVRDAMSRFDQTDLPSDAKATAAKKIVKRAKALGVDPSGFAKTQGITIDTDVDAGADSLWAETHEHHAGEFSTAASRMRAKRQDARKQQKFHERQEDGFNAHLRRARGYGGNNEYNRGASEKHRQAAHHFARAADAYRAGDEAMGDMHRQRGETAASAEVKPYDGWHDKTPIYAGGPGSGPRPGDAHPHVGKPLHEGDTSISNGPTSVHNEAHAHPGGPARGFGEGQTDAYGTKHAAADRDATINEFKKRGYTDSPHQDPRVQARDVHSFQGPQGTEHSVTVYGDGSFEHYGKNQYDHGTLGKSHADIARILNDPTIDASAGRKTSVSPLLKKLLKR